jgi:hypothetical protein
LASSASTSGEVIDLGAAGFSVQLATARFIGRFLADPLDGVPTEVVDHLAGQLQIPDPSQVKKYAQRQQTHLDHAAKIRKALKLKDFAQVEPELAALAISATVTSRASYRARASATCSLDSLAGRPPRRPRARAARIDGAGQVRQDRPGLTAKSMP